jgi:hypothetical protein
MLRNLERFGCCTKRMHVSQERRGALVAVRQGLADGGWSGFCSEFSKAAVQRQIIAPNEWLESGGQVTKGATSSLIIHVNQPPKVLPSVCWILHRMKGKKHRSHLRRIFRCRTTMFPTFNGLSSK